MSQGRWVGVALIALVAVVCLTNGGWRGAIGCGVVIEEIIRRSRKTNRKEGVTNG